MTLDIKGRKFGCVLRDEKATRIPVLDAQAYGRWPHLFSNLAREHDAPADLIITLLYLWDGTMGSANAPGGDVSISQIPVRTREKRKWLAALCAAGLFERVSGPAGSTRGDAYYYDEQATPEKWDEFFQLAARSKQFDHDQVSVKVFARNFACLRLTEDERKNRLRAAADQP